jgi:hypothetical protein
MKTTTDLFDQAVRVYEQLNQWHGWPLVCGALILIYLVAYVDLRRSKARDRTMSGKKFSAHQGPKVEYLIYKALSEAKIKEEISDKTYFYWARWFGWHGFEKFKPMKKVAAGSARAEAMKKKILDKLGLEEKQVNLPG